MQYVIIYYNLYSDKYIEKTQSEWFNHILWISVKFSAVDITFSKNILLYIEYNDLHIYIQEYTIQQRETDLKGKM